MVGYRTDSDLRPAERRRDRRLAFRMCATAIQDGYEIRGRIRNVSGGGALLELDPISATSLFFERPLELVIERLGRFPARIAWKSTVFFGLMFLISDSMADLLSNRIQHEKRVQAAAMIHTAPHIRAD